MAELLLGVQFVTPADQVINNNASVVDAAKLELNVSTINVNNETGDCYQHLLEVELDLGYDWSTGEYVSEEMSVRFISCNNQLAKWLETQEIDPVLFKDKLLKLLVAVYTADNSKYKRYFWTTHNVWLDEWDF